MFSYIVITEKKVRIACIGYERTSQIEGYFGGENKYEKLKYLGGNIHSIITVNVYLHN